MSDKTIVIAGYPKSGTTWVTRLVAELVGCPVSGFWKASKFHNEIAKEGDERVSDFTCYKSHHSFDKFAEIEKSSDFYLIQVIRDPRDIALSASHFFSVEKGALLRLRKLLYSFKGGPRLYRPIKNRLEKSSKSNSRFISKGNEKLDAISSAIVDGNKDISAWLVPWADYVNPFLVEGNFYLRYEDVLDNPRKECGRILEYLSIERTDNEIESAIESQSFKKLKQKFDQAEDGRNSSFLRQGKSGTWQEELTDDQKSRFAELSDTLKKLAYPDPLIF